MGALPLLVGVAAPPAAVAALSAASLSSPCLLLSSSSAAAAAVSTAGRCRAREVASVTCTHLFPLPSRFIVVSRRPAPEKASLRDRSRWVPGEGVWEDPDDGYGSEYEEMDDDDEEEEDNDREEEQGGAVSGYEGLRREIELLLSPEEKAILQQNETPDLGKISTRKWNPLHTLALSGQIPFMDKLLENGIDVDAVDKDGLTALHKAVIGKKEAVISHLLRKGANPHVRDKDGATVLHHAAQVGAVQTVKLLIKYKVDINVADNDGWTPLHVAIQSRSRDIAKVLLVNGADKTRRNKDGKTPLDLSLCYGKDFKSYELAKLLKLVPANRDL